MFVIHPNIVSPSCNVLLPCWEGKSQGGRNRAAPPTHKLFLLSVGPCHPASEGRVPISHKTFLCLLSAAVGSISDFFGDS